MREEHPVRTALKDAAKVIFVFLAALFLLSAVSCRTRQYRVENISESIGSHVTYEKDLRSYLNDSLIRNFTLRYIVYDEDSKASELEITDNVRAGTSVTDTAVVFLERSDTIYIDRDIVTEKVVEDRGKELLWFLIGACMALIAEKWIRGAL